MKKGEPMSDYISRQAAIDAHERIFDRCEEIEAHLPEGDPDRVGYKMYPDWLTVWKYLRQMPSAEPQDWMEQNKDRILKAGMEGREVEFRIGGRLFAIREKAQ